MSQKERDRKGDRKNFDNLRKRQFSDLGSELSVFKALYYPVLMIASGADYLLDLGELSIYKFVFRSSLCILLLRFLSKKQRRLRKRGQVISMTVSKDREES